MPTYQCKIICTDAAGLKLYHRFRVNGADLAEGQSRAANALTYYQPCVGVQVSTLFVEGVESPFDQLRGAPAGNIHNRLIIGCYAARNPTRRQPGQIQLALSDPDLDLAEYLTGQTDQEAAVYSNFISFLSYCKTITGEDYDHIAWVKLAHGPKVIDHGLPGSEDRGSEFEDFEDLNVVKQFRKTVFLTPSMLKFVGALTVESGNFEGANLSPTSTSSVKAQISLNDYTSGDITLTTYYYMASTSGGNIVWQLETASKTTGETTAVQTTQTQTVASGAATQIHALAAWTIAAADLASGDFLAVNLGRLGNNSGDTESNYSTVLGLMLTYLATVPGS